MKFEITETEKYKFFVKNEQSMIELAKVEVLQKIAEQLETLNKAERQIAEQLEQLNKTLNKTLNAGFELIVDALERTGR